MIRSLGKLFGVLMLAVMAVAAVFMAGMRTKSPRVLAVVRRVNRAVWNPRTMETAGTPGAYASVIKHEGRTSGRAYETPVGAVATDDGFVIALPYGSQADWLKNVLASGSATIVDEGDTHRVDQPEIVATSAVESHFSEKDQRSHRMFGVDQFLTVRRTEPEVADPA